MWSNSCFEKVEVQHYIKILSHDACKLWDQCLHFEIKSVFLSLALKLDGLGIQCPRGFPYQCFLERTGALNRS